MTALATKNSNAMTQSDLDGLSWGSEGVDSSDVLIPRILLMQGLSKLVSEGKAGIGDIVRSTTKDVIAKRNEKLEFIPLMTFKTWVNLEKPKGKEKFEYRSTESMTVENAGAALEYMVEGTPWRRDKVINFYVLLPADIRRDLAAREKMERGELPDPADVLLPCLLSFRRTSYGTGKELSTHFIMARQFQRPPAAFTFRLGAHTVKNDQGTFHVLDIEKAGPTPKESLTIAHGWYETLTKAKIKLDDEEVDEPMVSGQPVDGSQRF